MTNTTRDLLISLASHMAYMQDRLEQLYADDGRHDPAHPMHCLYTGLTVAAQEAADE